MENNKKEDRMPNENEYVDKEGHIRSFDTLEVRGTAFVEELLDAMRKKERSYGASRIQKIQLCHFVDGFKTKTNNF